MLRVQNTAARLIVGACLFDHMMPILKDLHWLPIPANIQDPATYVQLSPQSRSILSA